MSESVLIAIITGILAVLGSYVGNVSISRKKAREDAIREAKKEQSLTDRLDRLEKKVEEHNYWGKKFGDVSESIKGIQKDIEWLKKSNE